YPVVTRGGDPVKREALRMEHMPAGYASGDKTMLQAIAYVSFQELATRVSHRNTGRAAGEPLAEQLLARIAVDENLHMVFYRNLVAAAFDVAPDETMQAVRDEVVGFQMPGAGMPGFRRHSGVTAQARIHELRLHHCQGRHLRSAASPRRGRRARPQVLAGLRPDGSGCGRRAGPRGVGDVHGRARCAGGPLRRAARTRPCPRPDVINNALR